jgi:hypothetical protein
VPVAAGALLAAKALLPKDHRRSGFSCECSFTNRGQVPKKPLILLPQ